MWQAAVVMIAAFSLLAFYARSLEKRSWNNGFCKCGGKWIYFDTDSQGGRGYKCDVPSCQYGVWISYNVDKTTMKG